MSKLPATITLTLCRGLPGSGKSTWAKEQVRRSLGDVVRVSRDDIRLAFYGVHILTGPDRNREERLLSKIQMDTVRGFLVAKKDVIVDDTNLSMRSLEAFYSLASEFEGAVQIRFQDFEVDLKECIRRDDERAKKGERHVGGKNIQDIADRHLNGGSNLPELPAKYYERIGRVPEMKQDSSLPSAWIVDLDGTLALAESGRSYYDWSRVDEDSPIERAIALVRLLHAAGHTIVIVTGRDAVCEAETKEWLEVWGVPYDLLIMRPEEDSRGDELIMAEIFHVQLQGKYFIAGILDDRKKVVDMWRSKGLFVAQVAPGLF
jgi:predicted kinase